MGKRWTEAEEAFLRKHYVANKTIKTTKMFNKKFPKRTKMAILAKSRKMGLSSEIEPGFYSVSEIATLADMSPENVLDHISRGRVQARKMGPYWLVKAAEAEKFIAKSNPKKPHWKMISAADAVRRLGYESADAISKRIRASGDIPSIIQKGCIYIPLDYIEAAEDQLRNTGFTRVIWKKIHEELGYE